MIQQCADGTMLCWKCCKSKPAPKFLYTHNAHVCTELQDYSSMGHAWACEDCFVRSQFSKMFLPGTAHCMLRLPSDSFPSDRRHDLTQCIHCKDWKPAFHFSCYGGWWHSIREGYHPDALHGFIEMRGLVWGCNECFEKSQLYARWDGDRGIWRSDYKPPSTRARHGGLEATQRETARSSEEAKGAKEVKLKRKRQTKKRVERFTSKKSRSSSK